MGKVRSPGGRKRLNVTNPQPLFLIVPFTTILPGEIATIQYEFKEGELFRVERVVIKETYGGLTTIPFIFVASKLQHPVPTSISDGIPSRVFYEEANNNNVQWDPISKGQYFTFFVKNHATKPAVWSVCLMGHVFL